MVRSSPGPVSAEGPGSDLRSRLASLDPAALAALALADQHERWRRGERVTSETYLERVPGLAADPTAVLALAVGEWRLRVRAGERPAVADYAARFPAVASVLPRYVELDQDIAGGLLEALTDPAVRAQTVTVPGAVADHDRVTPPLPATASDPAAAPDGPERFTVLRLHAAGGLGQVFVARDRDLSREVALKTLRPECEADPSSRGRFLREAQVTGQLEHPNIVPVYAAGRGADGRPFYAMRLVRGQTLADAVAAYHARRKEGREDPLDRPRLLTGFVGVCQAVAFAHSRGVLHRDLKPSNVVLGSFGEVLLLDWGLAKLAGQPDDGPGLVVRGAAAGVETAPGGVAGTPAYMAPEQAEGEGRIDERSDVYGLGSILYEILTGRPPRTGRTALELIFAAATRDVAPPRRVEPSVPRALDAVCTKALARDPAARYQRAAEVAEDVQRFLADEPVSAWREPVTVKARRWVGRHRTAVAVAAASVVVLAASLAVSAGQLAAAAERERLARVEAEDREREAREQHDRATANFRLAREAVDKYLDRVTDSAELKARGLERLRKSLLETGVGFQRELIRQGGDDPGLRAERGRALWRLAGIVQEIGTLAEALDLFRQAWDTQDRLVREFPDDPTHREDRARTDNQLGNVSATAGKLGRAEEYFNRALADRRALVAGSPTGGRRADVAATLNNLANLYRQTGRWHQAEAAYEEAVAVTERLSQDDPTGGHARVLARTLSNLGVLRGDLGHPDRAEETHRQAVGRWEELAKAAPADPEVKRGLADARVNLGLTLAAVERPRQAEAEYKAAADMLDKLAEEHPAVGDHRHHLAKALNNLGLLLAPDRPDDAVAALRKALALDERLAREFPTVLDYRRSLAGTRTNLAGVLSDRPGGDAEAREMFRRAVTELELLAREYPDVPGGESDLADALDNFASSDTAGPEALALALRALAIREWLGQAAPDVPAYAARLAQCRDNLARLYVLAGQTAEAAEQQRLAAETWERLATAYPAAVVYRDDLARHHLNRGILAALTKRTADAVAALSRARDVWAALARERPAVARFRERAAKAEALLAPLLRDAGRLDEAEVVFRSAAARWEELTGTHPDVRRYKADLGQAYYSLGSLDALQRLRAADALPWYDRAIATLAPLRAADPSDPAVRRSLFMSHLGRAVALGLLGRHLECYFEWERAAAVGEPAGGTTADEGRRLAARSAVSQAASRVAAEARRWWPFR